MERLQIENSDIREALEVIHIREELVGIVCRLVLDVNRLVSTDEYGWFSFVGLDFEPSLREHVALWYEMINEWDLASMSRSVVEQAEEMCLIDRGLQEEYERIEPGVNEKWAKVKKLREDLRATIGRMTVAEPLRGDLIFVARSCWRQMSCPTQKPVHVGHLVDMVVTTNKGVTEYQLQQDGYKVPAWMTSEGDTEEVRVGVWKRAEAIVWTMYCFAAEEGLIGLN